MSDVNETSRHIGTPPFVLASASPVRARVLASAGVAFETVPSAVDEAPIKDLMGRDGASSEGIAMALAEAKARDVSQRRPDAVVLGADQVLVDGGVVLDKPADRAEARSHLLRLCGHSHRLVNGLCVVRSGTPLWRHVDSVTLHMRPASDPFIDAYLDAAGDDVLISVGAYRIEGLGAQLFSRIDGDYFSVLGLPLLPLLEFLRQHGILSA
jgi:septum formation protein